MRSLALLGLVLTLGVAACGGGSEQKPVPASGMPIAGGGLSVSEALASDLDGPLMVKGYVVVAGGETRLCEALAESFPPQCAGASLRVEGFDLATREGVQEAGGVSWTDETVSILGDVEDETITVSATSA